jgi:hypothetical protein
MYLSILQKDGDLYHFDIRYQNQNSIWLKTFPENWDSKAPSVGTLLAYLETMKLTYEMI